MSKGLLVVGHPYLMKDSKANQAIVEGLCQQIPDLDCVCLAQEYPDYQINIVKEQNRLRHADYLILQFPIFWYGIPSDLKRWLEEVFQFGFSHGIEKGVGPLVGKKLLLSFTTSIKKEALIQEQDLEELIYTLKALAAFTQMDYLGYVATTDVGYLARQNPQMAKTYDAHVQRILQMLADHQLISGSWHLFLAQIRTRSFKFGAGFLD